MSKNKKSNLDLVISLMGPTASGKTDLALDWADQFGYEIVSVDSAMIYRHMNIGTGKPNDDILKKYHHYLVDICEPNEIFSVAKFCELANKSIQEILSKNKTPLLVGGTMLYYKALQFGLSELPKANANIRQEILHKANRFGWEKLHQELTIIDPEAANIIKNQDKQRIQRALEVYYISNKPISSYWNSGVKNNSYKFENRIIWPDREILHKNIQSRFDKMLAEGFIDEVKFLQENYDLTLDHPSVRSIGYKQIWLYLLNQLSYQEMYEQALAATRQLAKRQYTWLRMFKRQGVGPNSIL